MTNIELYNQIIDDIQSLSIYANVSTAPVIRSLYSLCKANVEKQTFSPIHKKQFKFINILINQAEQAGLSGNIYKKLLLKTFLDDENIFSLSCERREDAENSTLWQFAAKDMDVLDFLLSISLEILLGAEYSLLFSDYTPVNSREYKPYDEILLNNHIPLINKVAQHYKLLGVGNMAFHSMFFYDSQNNCLKGVQNEDVVYFHNIVGYEYQKDAIKSNTEAFLSGYPANNTLLCGSRGTGKSSCVKATAAEYFSRGLRIIEITKEQILELPNILSLIACRGQHFILFIDDLSFEDFEIEYKHMKSLLEGSAGARPKNVLFYATSNRRHIISEKWSDKYSNPDDDEIHASDMVNEKMSLSDRFGLMLTFSKPTPKEYLSIVKTLAKAANLTIFDEELTKKAMAWELNNKGLSGRTARQFIDNLSWQMNK